ncbi:hypothetical protein ACFXJ5_28590 [Streptomyces sp. NPDC059373]
MLRSERRMTAGRRSPGCWVALRTKKDDVEVADLTKPDPEAASD